MNTPSIFRNLRGQDRINALYTDLQRFREAAEACNRKEVQGGTAEIQAEIYGAVFEEHLESAAITQKRLIRELFRQGEVGEVEIGIEVGTFPPLAIQGAFNRI